MKFSRCYRGRFVRVCLVYTDEARQSECGVLVHCLAGISRSVTVIVAYLMHALDLSLSDAYDHVKRCKPDVSPNFSFMGQLMDFERALVRSRRPAAGSSPPYLAVAPPSSDGGGPSSMDGVDLTGRSSPVSSLSSLSTSSAAAALSSCSSASSAFDYEIPAPSRHVNC